MRNFFSLCGGCYACRQRIHTSTPMGAQLAGTTLPSRVFAVWAGKGTIRTPSTETTMHALRILTLCVASLTLTGLALAQTPTKVASAKKVSKPAAKTLSAVAGPPPAADNEQLMAAAVTLYGQFDCEYDQKLTVNKHPAVDGYIEVTLAKRTYLMKPVRSTTGAVRLEEVSGSMLMVQIPSKSMLMDTKMGKRIVDACKNDEQRREVETANSLGINSPGQVQATAGATTVAAKPAR
jgi:hypothetical protein